ncbi:hypothetical protein [Motiliproteus sp. MSK22-1]|uniref:hypothetical protein n=1 Tax=Motiliproteus sp. MSK22-1 TaxID=1897630 RepID=UPI0009776A85|nr:hypothetical protein [Motiliproteus sp. MSK22-1]OMH39601.1 hypothetical protein BGP75_01770 [Motiliproteus sp. MSK22-1]
MELALRAYKEDPIIDSLIAIQGQQDEEFWSFKSHSRRKGAHSLIHYPAMMVPALQGTLIDALNQHMPIQEVLDPFVGSGTVMVESMNRGMNFTGVDINPLAVLSCLVKSGPYYDSSLSKKANSLLASIKSDSGTYKVREFFGRDKWFHKEISQDLEKISANIKKEKSLWARRIFWLALCRVVRSTSNSRLSTYKLHKKSDSQISEKKPPIPLFEKYLKDIFSSISDQKHCFQENGLISKGRHLGKTSIYLSDIREALTKNNKIKDFDLIMTSPPYGDNQTTIPYGQFSYLPLNWVDLEDIDKNINKDILLRTNSIDSASLGGSLKESKEKIEYLAENYPSAKSFISQIMDSESGLKRFSSFFIDLDNTIDLLSNKTKNNGYQAWTIGNRRITQQLVPMHEILIEMLDKRSLIAITSIERKIAYKKMAKRNNISDTMDSENIIIAKMDRQT